MRKKAIRAAAVLLALAAGSLIFTVRSAKKTASDAVDACNAAVREYNKAVVPYNEAAAGIADANGELQAALDTAQAVLDAGAEAYEPDTREALESTVQRAGRAFSEAPAQIESLALRETPEGFRTKELALAQHEAEKALKTVEESMEKIPDIPEVPDYAGELEAVRTAQKRYEDSVRKLANVTAPSDAFVKERLERIGTVTQAEAVTADRDPNSLLGREGGYTGCVYFLDERIDRSLLPREVFVTTGGDAAAESPAAEKENAVDAVMTGALGGGAVEIFSSGEDAEKRAEYISFFDGSVMEAGSCAIEGTCLIRTSRYLDDEQQERLTEEIREALLSVDE